MSESSNLFTWAARSDVGRVREVNQDSAHASEWLFVVADGMGGHRGGEVASAVAVDVMASEVATALTLEQLVQRVRDANTAILDRASRSEDLAGMGTTLCAIAPLKTRSGDGPALGLVNVGDSRIYRFVDDQLEQVSQDHSLVGALVREGHLSPAEAAAHPQRNIVTRALGIGDEVQVDFWELAARPGERYILCSDGLVDEVTDPQIAAVLRRLVEPGEVADELVRLANDHGARDNVTVLVLRVDGGVDGDSEPVADPPSVSTEAVTGPRALGPAEQPEPVADYPEPRRGSRLKALVAGFAVLVILGAGLILVGLYARNNYYVAFEQDQVVIFQGRPDGVLWFDPTVEEPTAFLRADLSAALELEIDASPQFDTVRDAQGYVADLGTRISDTSADG